ncbi:MAG: histidine kinase [Anaerolineales bacterium]
MKKILETNKYVTFFGKMSRLAIISSGLAVMLTIGTLLLIITDWADDQVILLTGSGAVLIIAVLIISLVVRSQSRIQSIGIRLQAGFILMALLPTIGISIGAVVLGYVDGQRRAINQLESVVVLKELELTTWSVSLQDVLRSALIDQFASERVSIVLDLANEDKRSEIYSGAMRTRLSLLMDETPQIKELFLVDLRGRIAVSTDPQREGKTIQDEPFFQEGLKDTFVQLPFGQTDSTGPADFWVYASRPVFDQDGKLLGVIAARVTWQSLVDILSDPTGLGLTGKLFLSDQSGTLLLTEDLPGDEQGNNDELKVIDNLMLVADRVDRPGIYRGFNQERVIGVYRGLPELNVVLAAEQEGSEAFRMIYTGLGINVAISLLTLVLAMVISVFLTRSITHPLVDLAEAATHIAAGELDRSVQAGHDDEVGKLAGAFNAMTAQLRDLIANLEQRVADRTMALDDAMKVQRHRALQLETSAQVSREVTSILSIDELLCRVVELIKNTFGYYHVNISLLKGDTLVQRASTRETKPKLRRIKIDSVSLNSEALQTQQVIVANDVLKDSRYKMDEHLPDTRSEMVIPLILRDKVIGTMDIVSVEQAAFTEQDTIIFQSLGDQVAIAIENARLYARSRELATVEERNRLARDLHDSVTQTLSSLNILVEGWRQQINGGKTYRLESYLDRVGEITDQALKEMRLMVYELRPADLDQRGLLDVLHHRLEVVEKRFGIEARLIAEELFDLPDTVEDELYWIAHEALNNALKHAEAERVTINLHQRDGNLILAVADNGCGFEVGPEILCRGVGIGNMEERAKQLGGTLEIETAEGSGTTIRAIIPSEKGGQ